MVKETNTSTYLKGLSNLKGVRDTLEKASLRPQKERIPEHIKEAGKKEEFPYRTPSQSPFPVFVLCQPMYVDTKVTNNIWMKNLNGEAKEIDKEKFMGEWYNLYGLLGFDSMVLLIPPKKGLQDQTYVNCAAYLPHLKDRDVIVLSNFTAEGRTGEEDVAGAYFKMFGYEVVKNPYKFEGEPELKWLKEDVYFGGYGIRSQLEAHKWISDKYGCTIIPIYEKDKYLYHLDCTLFCLSQDEVMLCTELIDQLTIKKIEKVANIHSVTKDDCMECICNSLRIGDLIVSSSSLMFMKKREPEYNKEYKKNKRIEEVCSKLGLELIYVELSEAAKSGAALSCFVMHLNYRY